MFARNRHMMRAALRTHPPKPGGMIGGSEFKAVNVGAEVDVVAVGVFVDKDTGIISGYHHIVQDREGSVVVSRGDQATGAMGRFGGLNTIDVWASKRGQVVIRTQMSL